MRKREFKALYDYCQSLTTPISRNQILQKTKEVLSAEHPINCYFDASLDPKKVRGYFLRAEFPNHKFLKNGDYIVLAKGLNKCWQRLVFVKELMHLFDDGEEMTSDKSILEDVLNTFSPTTSGDGSTRTPAEVSERLALWMALACLCPESMRKEFITNLQDAKTDTYTIALALKLPELHIPHLLSATMDKALATLIDKNL